MNGNDGNNGFPDWPLMLVLTAIALAALLVWVSGCSLLADRVAAGIASKLPPAPDLTPQTPWEELLATGAAALAIVGHRYLFHKSRKGA